MRGLAAAALLFFCCVATAEEPAIPIHAWMGPPAAETDLSRYRELADAGFTHSFSHFPDRHAMAAGLDIAEACGIRLFVNCPELRTDPEHTALLFKDHPALAGYHLRDEPSAGDFADLARWVERIRSVDDEHFCYINLFPTYANEVQLGTKSYEEHVARFVAEVPVQVISFDHYPVESHNGSVQLRKDYYRNLTIIADAAREAGKPFWAFTMGLHLGIYPVPEISHIRLQVFSDLVYGAQGIQYFTYWTPDSEGFASAALTVDGKRSPVYARVKEVNTEISGWSRVFAGASVVQVGHVGKTIPEGTKRFTPPAPIIRLDTHGNDALASHLRNGEREFLAIVNTSLEKRLRVDVEGQPILAIARKDGVFEEFDSPFFGATLDPGDMVVLTWYADTTAETTRRSR